MKPSSSTPDAPISVGDLVQVIRPASCCGNADLIGHTFQVTALKNYTDTHCVKCGHFGGPGVRALGAANGLPTRLYRLKRIPPASELGIVDEKEDLREPA